MHRHSNLSKEFNYLFYSYNMSQTCSRCEKKTTEMKGADTYFCMWCERFLCIACSDMLYCGVDCFAKCKHLDELHTIYWKASMKHFTMCRLQKKEAQVAKKSLGENT